MNRSGEPSPWDGFTAQCRVGDSITVTVTRTLPFGCLVDASGVPGLLRTTDRYASGERVEARIDAVDPERRRVSLVAART